MEVEYVEVTDLAARGTDIVQRVPCMERDCSAVAPMAAMKVWRVWHLSGQKWVYFPFCTHVHAMKCFPINILGRA